MIFIKINNTLYPATVSGRVADRDWDNRESKSINIEMDYATAIKLFVNGLAWSIVEQFEIDSEIHETEYDNSEYNLAGDLTIHTNGTCTVKMGKPTDLENAYEMLYGGI